MGSLHLQIKHGTRIHKYNCTQSKVTLNEKKKKMCGVLVVLQVSSHTHRSLYSYVAE